MRLLQDSVSLLKCAALPLSGKQEDMKQKDNNKHLTVTTDMNMQREAHKAHKKNANKLRQHINKIMKPVGQDYELQFTSKHAVKN